MEFCSLHKDKECKKVCRMCRQPYCEVCSELTEDSGLCLSCERKRCQGTEEISRQRRVGRIVSALACLIAGAVLLVVSLFTNGFDTLIYICAAVLAVGTLFFGLLAANDTTKINTARRQIKRLTEEMDRCKADSTKNTADDK